MDKFRIPKFIRQFLNNEGQEMEIQPPDEQFIEDHRVEKLFSPEELQPHLNFDCVGFSNEINSGETPFAEMSTTFEDLHPKWWLKKKVIRCGEGEKIPNFSVVYFHYNSYLEMNETPFDSSFLRNGKPSRIQLGIGAMYEGIEHALLSMSKGERAYFLVHHKLAFGKFGVPPRIPGEATILNVIEVHDVVDCGAVLKIVKENNEVEEQQFKISYDRALGFANLAKDHFVHGLIPAAILNYKRGLEECLNAKPETSDQKVEMQKLFFRFCLNIMVCYNHKISNKPKEVISTARDAIHLVPSYCNTSSKFFFNLGKAHLKFSDYTKACLNFKKALSLEPLNPETIAILQELETKVAENKKRESEMWSKGLGIEQKSKETDLIDVEPSGTNKIEPSTDDESSSTSGFEPSGTKKSNLCPMYTEKEVYDMEKEIYKYLSSRRADKNWTAYTIPGSFMWYELKLYKKVCEQLGLTYEEVKKGVKKVLKLLGL